jgi:hypothetical protein
MTEGLTIPHHKGQHITESYTEQQILARSSEHSNKLSSYMKGGEFLDSCMTVGFSKGTLPHEVT